MCSVPCSDARHTSSGKSSTSMMLSQRTCAAACPSTFYREPEAKLRPAACLLRPAAGLPDYRHLSAQSARERCATPALTGVRHKQCASGQRICMHANPCAARQTVMPLLVVR